MISPPASLSSTRSRVSAAEALRRFARTGEETAFAELVAAFAPLVRNAALRRLEDAHLAEEAAQNVFILLARKAPALAARPAATLSAWLHRATVLEAAALSRARARRQRRLHRAIAAGEWITPSSSAAPEHPAGPWLDDALNRLSEADRALLLARYYEERPFRELAAAWRQSEEALKKRTQRALAKLAVLLSRRGLKVSGAVPSALLGAGFSPASASPLTIASTEILTVSALSAAAKGAGGISLFTQFCVFMSATKPTVTAAAALLLLLFLTYRQVNANAALRRETAELQAASRLSADTTSSADGTAKPERQRRPRPRKAEETLPDPLDGMSVVKGFARSYAGNPWLYDPGPSDLYKILMKADAGEILRLIEEVDRTPCSAEIRRKTIEMLVTNEMTRRDPAAAARLGVERRLGDSGMAFVMQIWAGQDPEAAWSWFQEMNTQGKLLRARAGGADQGELFRAKILGNPAADSGPADALAQGFGKGLAEKDKAAAEAFVRVRAAEDAGGFLLTGAGRELLPLPGKRDTFLELVAALPNDAARRQALLGCAGPLVAARAVPAEMEVVSKVREIVEHPAFPQNLRGAFLLDGVVKEFPDSSFAPVVALHELSPPEEYLENLASLAERRAEKSANGSVPVIPDGPEAERFDRAYAATAAALAERGNAALAAKYAAGIHDETLRQETLTALEK